MRTIARATAFQIVLRNCSKEVGGRSVLYMILVKRVRAVKHTFWQKLAASQSQGADVTLHDCSAFLDMRRCKNWAHKIFS